MSDESAQLHADAPSDATRILLVDDDPLGRKLLTLRLTQAGFSVITAPTAALALELARAQPPDALVSDLRMPGMSGFELCETFRADPRLAHVQVLLLSSSIEESDRQRALELGVPCFTRGADLSDVIRRLAATLAAVRRPKHDLSVKK